MTDAPSYRPAGRSDAASFLVCDNADAVLDFAKAVFGATERARPIRRGDGSLWNCELNIGDSTIMVGATQGDIKRPGFVYVSVPDAKTTFAKALEHGATEIMPVARRFYGADDGGVEDTGGNWWWIGTQIEDLTDDEIADRARQEEASR